MQKNIADNGRLLRKKKIIIMFLFFLLEILRLSRCHKMKRQETEWWEGHRRKIYLSGVSIALCVRPYKVHHRPSYFIFLFVASECHRSMFRRLSSTTAVESFIGILFFFFVQTPLL